jgi:hypothetical protein
MNHARFMISPELHVVRDRVQGFGKEGVKDEEMSKVSNEER